MSPDPQRSPRSAGRRWLAGVLFVGFVVAPLVTVAISGTFLFRPEGRVLEVEMQATGGTAAQLFWSAGFAFSEADSTIVPLHQHPGDFERVRFPLPSRPLLFLRFDPINGPGEVLIRRMRVLDRDGRAIRTIDPIVMAALHQIEAIMPVGDDIRVVTTRNANDPMLLLRSAWMTAPPAWYSPRFVTPLSLAWIAAACLTLVVTALTFLARDVTRGPFGARDALWLTALFLVTLWAKLTLLDHYPMPVPFWDQWDGEASSLYLPFANGGLTWQQMFTLHNEHRVFFTRVLAMALLAINRQWDPQLQIVVNAVLHSLVAVIFAVILWLAAGRRWLPLLALSIGLAFAPPFALENTLAGFQSAFYFLVLFSELALWLMGMHRPGTPAWLIGWLCAFCSIVTVAGGILTVAAIGCLVVLKALSNPREWRQALVNMAALAAVGVLGYAALSPPLPYHDHLKAGTWLAFKVSFARNLAFPWITAPRSSVILWVPLLVVAAVVLFRRFRSNALEQIALALGAWVVLQAATIAYSRGFNGAIPSSRYLDMLSFGFVVNTVALVALLAARNTRRWRFLVCGALAVWVAAGSVGIAQLSRDILAKDGREKRLRMQEYVRNVRHFVVTGDLASFAEKRGLQELPYFSPPMLAGWLLHPYVRHILPATVREPFDIQPQQNTANTFSETSTPKDLLAVWDSYAGGRGKAQGRFESQPVQCKDYEQLRFEIAGSPGAQGMRLFLKATESGRETPVRPALAGGPGWSAVSVRCPTGPFTVVAIDESPTAWFAFRQPAEIGWASSAAESMIQQSRALGFVALTITLLALASTGGVRRQRAAGTLGDRAPDLVESP